MNPFALSGLLAGITSLSFGYFVYLKGKTKPLNRLWFVFTVSVAVWGFGGMWIGLARTETEALWAWRLAFALGVLWIPILFYHFVHIFCERSEKRSLWLLYAFGLVFFPFIFTDLFFTGTRMAFSSFYYSQPGRLFPLFFLWWVGIVVFSHYELLKTYRRRSGLKRSQIEYFFLATAIGYVGGSLDYLPIFEIDLYPFGNFAIVLYPIIMTYAIVKYRLMDITVAVEKGLTYLLLIALVVLPAYAVLLLAQKAFFGEINYQFSAVVALLLPLIVLAGSKMKHQAQAAVARVLFRNRHDMYETLATFSKALGIILDLKTLTEEIVRTLVNAMGIKAVALYLLDKEKGMYVPASSYGLKWGDVLTHHVTVANPLPCHVSKIQALVVREELEHARGNETLAPVIGSLRALNADVCVPFINKNSLVGFCVLGPRTTDQMYSDQDLSLLMTLAQAAAIALDNAVLYEELKRSQTLVRRADRLRSLETIAGGFAHEVRNPLTSIKTFIQLAPERKDDPEFIGHFGTVVAEDVARIERLIQEILDYARYMEPKFMEEDINDIVESCLYFVRIKADSKSVSLQKDLVQNLPPVTLDRQQIKQVLLNLLLNAVEAIGPGGGQVIVKTHRLTKSGGDSWVQVEVTDTGGGIAPGDLDHIFDPFYTTKHASDEREGTGLGLTIVHQIVQEHGGHITVDSQVGQGTTFLVNLPINPVAAHSTMGHARV